MWTDDTPIKNISRWYKCQKKLQQKNNELLLLSLKNKKENKSLQTWD